MKKILFFFLMLAIMLPVTLKAQDFIDFETQDFSQLSALGTVTNSTTYPWTVETPASTLAGYNGSFCMKSGNAGVSNSESSIEFTVTYLFDGSISFLGGCWGEGTTTVYDKCLFYIDGVQQFQNGSLQSWDTYTYPVSAGSHTFKWSYKKDSSVNPTGDAFLVDDILIEGISIITCPRPSSVSVTDIRPNSATLSWVDDAAAGNYLVQYKTESQNWDDETVFSATTSETEMSLSDLLSNTLYNVRVASVCSDENSLWRSTSFRTECGFITEVPVSWGFENGNTGGSESYPLPSCWDRTGSDGYPYVYNYYAHNGTSCLSSGYNPENRIAILPNVDFEALPLNTLSLRFFAEAYYADREGMVEVGLLLDTSFVVIGSISTDNGLTDSYKEFEFSFANYEGEMENVHIALRFNGDGGYDEWGYSAYQYIYVDDITLENAPACERPDHIVISEISNTSAVVSWAEKNASGYNVYYKKSEATEYLAYEGNPVSDTTVTLENLENNTLYAVRVASLCSDESEVIVTDPVMFRTECDAITSVPQTWDFESNNTGGTSYTLPSCWDRVGNTNYPYVYGYNTHSGDSCLYTGYEPDNYIVVLPPVDFDALPINTLQLRFYAYFSCNTCDGTIEVGLMSDPNDAGTFTTVGTINNDAELMDYAQYEVSFADYEGDMGNPYIAMRFYGTGGSSFYYQYIYVDDVTLENVPTCDRPENLAAGSITHNSATISWSGSEDISYNVYYKESDTTEWVAFEGNPVMDTTTTLENLNANTDYDVRVTSVCDDGSEVFSEPTSFTTLCDIFVVTNEEPYEDYFDNEPDCWRINDFYYDTDGYLYHTYSYSNGEAISPTFDLSAVNTPYLKFTQKRYKYSSPYSSGDYEPEILRVYYRASVNEDWAILVEYSDNCSNWRTDSVTLLNASETYQVKFAVNGAYGLTYIDSVIIYNEENPQECFAPAGLTISNLTSNSAVATWTTLTDDSEVELYYKEENETAFITISSSEIENNSYTLNDLEPNHTYVVYVASLCGEDTLATNTVSFSTPCVSTVITMEEPFSENFNGLTTGIPACWDNSEGSTTTAEYRWNYYAGGEEGAGLRFNSWNNSSGNTNMLKTPVLDLTALTRPQLSFYYKNPQGGDFSVFLSTDGGNTYTTPIATGLTNMPDWNYEEFVLPEMEDASSVVVVFQGTSNYGYDDAYIYLDNVLIGESSGCARPSGITVGEVTTNSAEITITDPTEVNNYRLYWTDGTTIDSVDIQNTTYNLTGLNPSSSYTITVVAICGDNVSHSMSTSFTTQCGAITANMLPKTWDFENDNLGGSSSYPLPFCWNKIGNTMPFVYEYDYYAHSGEYSLAAYTYDQSGAYYAILPEINIDEISLNTLQLRFFAFAESGDVTIEAGVMSDPTDTSSFISLASTEEGEITDVYNEFELPLTNYVGDGEEHYIALRFNLDAGNSYSAYIFIDDLVLETASPCPRPASLSCTATTSTSVSLSWQPVGENNQWDVSYGPVGFNPNGENVEIVSAEDTAITINDLTTGTAYDFYVRTDCGDAVSNWRGPILVIPGSYNMPTEGEETITTCDIVIYDDGGINNPYSYYCDGYLVLNPETEGSLIKATGTYYIETGTSSRWDYLQIFDGLETTGTPLFDSHLQGQQGNIDVTSTTGPLTLFFHSDSSVQYDGFELHISCVDGGDTIPTPPTPVTCNAPTNVAANNITHNSAVIDWVQEGTPDSWTVNYKKASVLTWTTVNVNAHPYTITDLEAETSYDVYVTANCDTASADSDPISFTTLTDGVNEYVNNTVIYPNPTTGQFTISNTQCVIESVEVFDVYGKLLNTMEVNDNTATIDVTNYASGIYFTRIHTDKGIVVKQIVKK